MNKVMGGILMCWLHLAGLFGLALVLEDGLLEITVGSNQEVHFFE